MPSLDTTPDMSLLKDKFGMGLGAFGYNLAAAGLMTYLTFFYTENMMISAASISIILFSSRIIDAFTDLWMGTLVDRCRNKHGKARPWLLWMAAPAAVSISAVYFVPPVSQSLRVLYAFVTHNLMAFFLITAMILPFNSMVSLITSDGDERLKLSQIVGFMTTLGAVFVNFFSTDIMSAFGGGNMGYFYYFSLTGFLGVILMAACFTLTRERVKVKESKNKNKLPVKIAFRVIIKNKYWWNAIGIQLMTALVPACWSSAAYYCIYWVNGAIDVGELMSLIWGGITVGILLFIPVSKKISKSNSAAIGLSLQAFGSLILWMAPTSVAMVWISSIFRSVGVGGLAGNFQAMLSDVVEYGEWKTDVRTEGMVYSGASFGYKVGTGLGTAIVAALLSWGGYVAGEPVQTLKAMAAIKYAFIVVPFIGSSLIILMLLLFRVEKLIPKIKDELLIRGQA